LAERIFILSFRQSMSNSEPPFESCVLPAVNVYYCSICNNLFSSLEMLEEHIKEVHKIEDDPLLPVALQEEIYAHGQQQNESCVCNICDREFENKTQLSHHNQFTHNVRKKSDKEKLDIVTIIKCNACGKEFFDQESLREHVKMFGAGGTTCVTNGKPLHYCEYCGKCFAARGEKRKHVNNHTRPFKCDICGNSFSRKLALREHCCKLVVKNKTKEK